MDPSRLQLVATVILVVAGAAAAEAVADPEAVEPNPKVEFVEVEGLRCLQPLVRTADAKLSDFRAAEQRWLAEKYPGCTVPRWETVIVLVPGQDPEAKPEAVTVQRETAHVHEDDGSTVTVCFDIDLAESETAPRE